MSTTFKQFRGLFKTLSQVSLYCSVYTWISAAECFVPICCFHKHSEKSKHIQLCMMKGSSKKLQGGLEFTDCKVQTQQCWTLSTLHCRVSWKEAFLSKSKLTTGNLSCIFCQINIHVVKHSLNLVCLRI